MRSENLKHYSQLDGLRCFAILFVMVGHWMSWDTGNVFLKNAPWGHGVILFFVLSGYLITNILLEQKDHIDAGTISYKQALGTFYVRRFLRIFPIYYLLIFYLYYINYQNTREIFPWLVTYTSNLLQCKTGQFLGDFNHFWSLAVEEQFYILWPFLILFTPRKNTLKLIIALLVISFVSRIACYLSIKDNWMLVAYFTPNLFLPLGLGALLAYAKRNGHRIYELFSNSFLMYTFAIVFSVCYYFFHFKFYSEAFSLVVDENLFALACTFFIAKASSNNFKLLGKRVLEHDLITFTGKISYGLYVYHLFMINFFWNYLSPKYLIHLEDKHGRWIMYFIIAYLLAIFSYYVIEKPINRLKDKFRY